MARSIVLAGGGTAGHVNPLLAVAHEVRTRYPDADIRILGTLEGLEADLVPSQGFELSVIPRVPLPRRPSVDLLRLPAKLKAAVRAASKAIADSEADVVIGFGGYVSTPAYIAARRAGTPIVVQEQNARAGIANKIGARWAAAVATSFSSTPLTNAQLTGLPLRSEIAQLLERRAQDTQEARREAASKLGLDPDKLTVVITGGSLGALKINQTIAAVAEDLLDSGAQILHLTGKGKADQVIEDIAGLSPELRSNYHVLEYLKEMHNAYAVADLVVCRSGAGTVCEIAALGLPAVFVPLPIGNGEQRLNADDLVRSQAALIVNDRDFTPEWVRSNVIDLMTNSDRLSSMSQAAAGVGRPRATQEVVDLIEHVAGWKND